MADLYRMLKNKFAKKGGKRGKEQSVYMNLHDMPSSSEYAPPRSPKSLECEDLRTNAEYQRATAAYHSTPNKSNVRSRRAHKSVAMGEHLDEPASDSDDELTPDQTASFRSPVYKTNGSRERRRSAGRSSLGRRSGRRNSVEDLQEQIRELRFELMAEKNKRKYRESELAITKACLERADENYRDYREKYQHVRRQKNVLEQRIFHTNAYMPMPQPMSTPMPVSLNLSNIPSTGLFVTPAYPAATSQMPSMVAPQMSTNPLQSQTPAGPSTSFHHPTPPSTQIPNLFGTPSSSGLPRPGRGLFDTPVGFRSTAQFACANTVEEEHEMESLKAAPAYNCMSFDSPHEDEIKEFARDSQSGEEEKAEAVNEREAEMEFVKEMQLPVSDDGYGTELIEEQDSSGKEEKTSCVTDLC